jgi:hypothetical protein
VNKARSSPPSNPYQTPHERDASEGSTSAAARDSAFGRVLKVCGVIFAVPFAVLLAFALTLFWIYGTDTHHANRNSIWWSERGRNLIPPAATDITLRQDFLDHYATYRISETDLHNFLNKRFADNGATLDSLRDRTPVNPERIGTKVGPLGWVVTEDTVEYSYAASNGGMHNYYHDSNTGLTYQDSAYW